MEIIDECEGFQTLYSWWTKFSLETVLPKKKPGKGKKFELLVLWGKNVALPKILFLNTPLDRWIKDIWQTYAYIWYNHKSTGNFLLVFNIWSVMHVQKSGLFLYMKYVDQICWTYSLCTFNIHAWHTVCPRSSDPFHVGI